MTATVKHTISLKVLTAHLGKVRSTQPRVTLREAQEQARRVTAAGRNSVLRMKRTP